MALHFTTDDSATNEIAPPIPFDLDDQELTAHCPKSRMWSRLIGALSSAATAADEQFAIGSFMDACFDDGDRVYLERRYRDRNDPLDDEVMSSIFEALMEEWAPYMGDEVERVRETRATAGARNRSERRQLSSQRPGRPRAAKKTPAASSAE
ncbi:hypothetical protein AB0J38_14390 [Streptomyces sp. NPDC050095]|uniref:hypothetical protein n=1 Tax=unclassified Streptomyces TaxID=2593676 RepID=UPI0034180258